MNPLNILRMEQDAEKQAITKVKLTDNEQYSIQTTSEEERKRIIKMCHNEGIEQGLPFQGGWEEEPYVNIDLDAMKFDTSSYAWEKLVILSTDIE